jgi:hypothetical protein
MTIAETPKKKMGRPITGRRDNYVCLPLYDDEKAMLVAYAKKMKTPVATLMRTLIFQSLPKE